MYKKIIYLIVLLICVNYVTGASYILDYPDYFDVNITERIKVISDTVIDDNISSYIFIDGTLSNMSKLDDYTFYADLLGDNESDTPYVIQVQDVDIENINSSDNSLDSFVRIDNTTYYGFYFNATDESHATGDWEYNEVCTYIKLDKGSPTLIPFIAQDNNTNGVNITFFYGYSYSITNVNYEWICLEDNYQYLEPLDNFTEYFGFYCSNCDSDNRLKLGVDTTSINNLSITFNDSNDNYTIDTTRNYMFQVLESEGVASEEFRGTFLFRNSYYITMFFYSGFNSSTKEPRPYKNEFDYVYMYLDNGTTGLQTPYYLGSINEFMALMPITKDYYAGKKNDLAFDRDISTFFWSSYTDGSATIKLYELGRYTVNLLGLDIKVISGDSFSEFDKPHLSDYKWHTQLTTLNMSDILENKTDVSFKIYVPPWEANKSQFILDMIKWGLVFLGLIVIIGIELGLGVDGKVIGYTILAYMAIMGGIGWIT